MALCMPIMMVNSLVTYIFSVFTEPFEVSCTDGASNGFRRARLKCFVVRPKYSVAKLKCFVARIKRFVARLKYFVARPKLRLLVRKFYFPCNTSVLRMLRMITVLRRDVAFFSCC